MAGKDPLKKVLEAQQRCIASEKQLEISRRRLYDAIAEAVEVGYTLSALGRELGMTRQNVQRLLRRARRPRN